MLLFTTLCYTTALTVASLLPSGPGAPGGWDTFVPPSSQNFLHLPAYTVLTILVLASTTPRWTSRRLVTVELVCGCMLFGILLEFLQAYIPGRCCSATDMLTNAAGTVVGLFAWRCLATKFAWFTRPVLGER